MLQTAVRRSRWGEVAVLTCLMLLCIGGWAHLRYGSVQRALTVARGGRVFVAEPDLRVSIPDGQDHVDVNVRVENWSSRPVTLVGSEMSCNCITLNELPVVIGPETSHTLPLRIHLYQPIPSAYLVRLFTDHPRDSKLSLTLRPAD